jgi:hypothetical protein
MTARKLTASRSFSPLFLTWKSPEIFASVFHMLGKALLSPLFLKKQGKVEKSLVK